MKKILYVFVVALMTMFVSCDKNENVVDDQSTPTNPEELYAKTEYNLDMRDFAMAVNEAINANKSFRKLIKEEAMRKFDGDYDVLLSKVVEKKLSLTQQDKVLISRVKSANQEFTVKDLLDDALNSVAAKTQDETIKNNISKMKRVSSSQSAIDALAEKYPLLQVSVPVHVDDLDNVDYIPPVTFVTEEAYKGSVDYLVAYKGAETILLSMKTEPSNAVVVVSLNERFELIEDETAPSAAILSGAATESGIRLIWSADDLDNINYFEIYKKTSNSSVLENVALISSNPKPYIYDDKNVDACYSYTYYVKSYNNAGESWSNPLTIISPQIPNPVKSFSAILQGQNEIELTWENDNSQYISSTKLYRRLQNVNDDYLFYKDFTSNESYSFDRNVKGGDRVFYRIIHKNEMGDSNGKYDFVYVPYRNILVQSPIVLDKISYSWRYTEGREEHAIENWFQGLPEFQIKILTIDSKGAAAVVFDEKVEATSTGSFSCNNRKLHNWLPSNQKWYDVLTFKVIEADVTWGSLKLTVDAKAYGKIGSDSAGASAGLTATYTSPEIKFGDDGEDMGIPQYYTYFDPINYTLSFDKFNFTMYLK